ncbi:MAG: 16S rRNA (cytosine(1402)-N(4))-methyltransferase RsmH [Patescibacteria group bacterium]|jgi:16S rRNA (cytosine1402-N4)-methyltransferase
MPSIHEPVLLKEVLRYLNPQPGDNFIDCTFGGGGHSLAILELVKPEGKVLGIDWDAEAIQDSANNNLILVNDNYRNLKKIIGGLPDFGPINGILLDLGLSSDQLAADERGFSFQSTGALDLRFNQATGQSAAELINASNEAELIKIFTDYGEEPLAKPIARAIIAARQQGRKIETAEELAEIVSDIYQKKFKTPSRKHPATRVFQALRIAVNDEFGNIATTLPQAIDLLAPGGRLAVISFHSGEDRLVKRFFKDMAGSEAPRIKLITKKPVEAGAEETAANPRSRSAKLRVIEKN